MCELVCFFSIQLAAHSLVVSRSLPCVVSRGFCSMQAKRNGSRSEVIDPSSLASIGSLEDRASSLKECFPMLCENVIIYISVQQMSCYIYLVLVVVLTSLEPNRELDEVRQQSCWDWTTDWRSNLKRTVLEHNYLVGNRRMETSFWKNTARIASC